jgi:hypothetical protein
MYTIRHANRCAPTVRSLAILKLFNPDALSGNGRAKAARRAQPHSRPPATQVARSPQFGDFMLVLRISSATSCVWDFGIRISNLVAATLLQNPLSFATLLHRLGREFPALRPPVACIIDGFCN